MFRQLVVVLAVLGVHASAFGQELDAWKQKASPEECELVDLLDSLYKEYQVHYAEAERISDWRKQWEFHRQSSPAGRFVPRLLEFEKRHQGSEVGLMALRRLVFLGAGGGPVGNPEELGRREALKRLPAYANRPVLADILRWLAGGHFESESRGLLHSLAHDSAADPTVRVFSRLMLADVMLSARNGRSSLERLIRELDEGAPPPLSRRETPEQHGRCCHCA
jgi:hypothetical protein